jgi:hypothetical protein
MRALLANNPDGFLIKMKRTKISKTTIEAIKEFELTSDEESISEEWVFQKLDKNRMLSVVNGTIEVVEVKTEKSKCNPLQTSSYRTTIKNGYPLRLFNVDLSSFIIKEKLIVNLALKTGKA